MKAFDLVIHEVLKGASNPIDHFRTRYRSGYSLICLGTSVANFDMYRM
jgi:hypothetical protein